MISYENIDNHLFIKLLHIMNLKQLLKSTYWPGKSCHLYNERAEALINLFFL